MQPGDFTIRSAKLEDWPVLAEFNQKLAAESENKRLEPATIAAGVRALLEDETKGRYLVACHQNGEIIGQLMHTREWSDWRNGEIWWLQSVYVAEGFRRQGVFRRLHEELEALAHGAVPRVVGLRLYVEQDNEIAQNVYRRRLFNNGGYFVMEKWFEEKSSSLV
ncbi:MAG: GNAT family N-acetyltransferase [Planctomycetota bacterium]|nr:GNAT family N-acetyltransferase [Planctomycetota bacterium]